jgi:membrane protein YdbS with pleckstrin-like domain
VTGPATADLPPAAPPPQRAPAIDDGIERPLDPRVIACDRVSWAILLAFVLPLLLGAAVIAAVVGGIPPLVRALVAALLVVVASGLAWLGWIVPELRHRYARYRVDRDGIHVRRGVWWRSQVHVPRNRIQHTDVSQGPLERNYGLGTLHVYTAGTQNAEVRLNGLEHGHALAIRDHLMTAVADDAV